MKKIRKAIIPAAGLGTRFLPATKTIPKEMLPIVDKPTILYNVEEAVKAGVEDIILIAGRGKTAIEDFFDMSYELEDHLFKKGKEELLNRIKDIRNMCNLISVRQKEPLGLGHAVLCGERIIGDEAFAVLLGDEVMITPEDTATVTGQLVNRFMEHGKSTVAVMKVPQADVGKYGVIGYKSEVAPGLYDITEVVEKPDVGQAPSCLALPGRYIFTPQIFSKIRESQPGKNGEIQLTDGMLALAKSEGMLACQFLGRRYDAGDQLGYLQANIELALERNNLKAPLTEYIKKLAEGL